MAWRPTKYLIEGALDNTDPGIIKGYMKFMGMKELVQIELQGNFHRDIRGAVIRFECDDYKDEDPLKAVEYFKGFSVVQTGKAGDITAGRPPHDYVDRPYIEWYSKESGRVVVEPEYNQVKVRGMPIPYIESDPIDRKEQENNLMDFMDDIINSLKSKQDKQQ